MGRTPTGASDSRPLFGGHRTNRWAENRSKKMITRRRLTSLWLYTLILTNLTCTQRFLNVSLLSCRNVLHARRLHQPSRGDQHRGHQRCGGKDPVTTGLFHPNSRAIRILPFSTDRIRVGQRFPLLSAGPQRLEAPRRFGLIDDSNAHRSGKAFINTYT